ncbi:hypothetical protein [Chamaesiphon sp. OTE_20_metabat_361]|uniref:hypothetical protein n=1 Tax=Chamaesiphon sp. OTE_20_metabat_361 TaxID=2964689 RepID=UPI00286B388D|nr:hypothetical protein [Chamaesiphon sp. OTE_20_metabat_361]
MTILVRLARGNPRHDSFPPIDCQQTFSSYDGDANLSLIYRIDARGLQISNLPIRQRIDVFCSELLPPDGVYALTTTNYGSTEIHT